MEPLALVIKHLATIIKLPRVFKREQSSEKKHRSRLYPYGRSHHTPVFRRRLQIPKNFLSGWT